MRSFLFTMSIFFILLGCMNHHSKQFERQITSDTAILRTTLKHLNLKNPLSDLNENIQNQDYRFIGVCGFVCYAPGIQDQYEELIEKYSVRILEGTSDAIESDEHKILIETATKYAKNYNEGLLDLIKSNKVP